VCIPTYPALKKELISRIEDLCGKIDAAYGQAAGRVGFSCEGCDGAACCTVDLPLHSFVEKFYLRLGFRVLDVTRQSRISDRCAAMLKAKRKNPHGQSYRNAVCVLNFDGLCSLYPYRPMICRLSGVPHVLVRPDGKTIRRGGCSRYELKIRSLHPDLSIDRTQFYREMASVEIEIIRGVGRRTRSCTIAEVLGGADPDSELLRSDVG